jgi:chromosome segregation ATPase
MPSTEDLVLDRLIASLQEVRAWKDKPQLLRAEIGSLKAERDTARAGLEQVHKELKDPSLNKQGQELQARIRREITDKEAERDVLVERVAKLRVEVDRLEALCKEKRDFHDQLLDSIDSLKKRIGVGVDPTAVRLSKVPLKNKLTDWEFLAEHERARQAQQQAAS